jgi:hypothetical protein
MQPRSGGDGEELASNTVSTLEGKGKHSPTYLIRVIFVVVVSLFKVGISLFLVAGHERWGQDASDHEIALLLRYLLRVLIY